MSTTTVSAVIPTFNRRELVRRALRSVTAQTRPVDEVIVVDDGSCDDTAHAVRGEFPGVRVVRQDHKGVSAARNHGLRVAAGEWIALLDSDDEWVPAKIERQLQALSVNPGFLVCHTDEIWIRNGRRVNAGFRHRKTGGHMLRECLPLCAISPSSVLMHRQLFAEVGTFDESLPACEDYDMWLRVCARFPVLLVDEPLVVKYGGHEDQLSRRIWGLDRFRILALERLLKAEELCLEDRRVALTTLLEKIRIFVNGAEKRGRREEVEYYRDKERFWLAECGKEVAVR